MASLQDLLSSSGDKSNTVSGHFICQTCGDSVYEASHNREKSTMSWKCLAGHISTMEWNF